MHKGRIGQATAFAIIFGFCSSAANSATAGFTTFLPPVPGQQIQVTAISDDGNVVAGTFQPFGSPPSAEAFRWTRSGSVTLLGQLDGGLAVSRAWAMTADGSTVVGSVNSQPAAGGFIWTESTGMVRFDTVLGGVAGDLTGISADGATLSGTTCLTSTSPCQGFIYSSSTGVVGLGQLPGSSSGSASSVSRDGSVVTGTSGGEAFRWSATDGMVGLGRLDPRFSSTATAAANGGSVITGFANDSIGRPVPVRWIDDSGPIPLGDFLGGPALGFAEAISADGSVIIGRAGSGGSSIAYMWTEELGMVSLLDYLVSRGAQGLEGWALLDANAISADGRWVAGRGFNSSLGISAVYVADLTVVPVPSAGVLMASTWLVLAWVRRKRG